MGYNKITNQLRRLDKDEIPKFTSIKWIEIFDQSNGTYNPDEDIRFKTPQTRDDLCDFNDAYIVVTGKAIAANPGNDNAEYDRKISLKNSALFFNCILKINSQLIEDAQDLNIVMAMFNLLYSSKNFRKTTGFFWNYYPDQPNSRYTVAANTCIDEIERRRFRSIYESESFNYKTKFINALPGINDNANNDVTTESEYIKIVVVLSRVIWVFLAQKWFAQIKSLTR